MVKKIVFGVIGIIVVLVIIGSLGGNNDSSKTATSTEGQTTQTSPKEPTATPAPTKIAAQQIADDFDANQVAAKANWNGKLVEFSATISNITESGVSFSNVASKQFSFTQIACRVQDKSQLLPLKNGQEVTVRGTVGDQTVGVIEVKNCQIVQ